MKGKIDSILRIPTTLEDFFKNWLKFLKPVHQLTEKEIDVTACILKHRHKYSKVISDNTILDKMTLSEDTKREIRTECGLSASHMQVVLCKLKKNKIITDGRINPKFIPSLTEEKGYFQLMLLFDIQDESS